MLALPASALCAGKKLATSESYQKLTEEQTSKKTSIVVNCRNNMAQVYSKQGLPREARTELEEVRPTS